MKPVTPWSALGLVMLLTMATPSAALAPPSGEKAEPSKAPPPASKTATKRIDSTPPPLARHTAANGLEVVVYENHAVPLVTVEIAFRNGAMTEPPAYSGVSHLYEHMFFKANAKYPSQEAYMARANALGIVFNGTTGTERVNYFFTTTSEHLDEAMEFMRDAITSPKFDVDELDREREVVIGEMNRAEGSPFFQFGRKLDEHLWYAHPSRKDALGSRQTVKRATVQMLRTIKQRYYVPNNGLLVVTGDVEPAKIFDQVDRLYADWKRGPDPFQRYPLVQHPPLRKTEVVVMENERAPAFVGQLSWHGPSLSEEELEATYAADGFATVLAEASSPFQQRLVESGHCLQASFGWFTQRNVGPISLSFVAAPNKAEVCTKAVFAEVERMKAPDYVSRKNLIDAAYRLKIDKIKERERPSEYAHLLTFWWASADIDYYRTYVEKVGAVQPKDVADFMRTYVLDEPFVLGALVTPEMKRAGITEEKVRRWAGIDAKGAGK